MSSKPLVSGIIAFLNAEEFIEEAIESVFAQTYDNWELLLVDDGSTDRSLELALRYAEQHPGKVRYLEHESHQNRGTTASRNLGVRHAKGEYLAFLDADDVWLPHKLEQQIAILSSHPEAGMLYGASQYWYSWTESPEDSQRDFVPEFGVETNSLYTPPALLTLLRPLGNGSVPCPSAFILRRGAIERAGGFEESFKGIYQMYEDQAFLCKIYLKERIFVANECWTRYRQHPEQCCAVVERKGQHRTARAFFLNWLEEYLSKQGVKDPRAWKALRQELWPYRYPTTASVEVTRASKVEVDPTLLWGHHIDQPKTATKTDGHQFRIMGWALGRSSPAVAVELVNQGEVIRRLPMNDLRPDLATAFPHIPEAQHGGFSTSASLVGMGELEVGVRAVLEDQRRVLLGTIHARRRWRDEGERGSEAPLVSVVIPCYEQARFLGEAIESVLAQTYPHFEVIVVDDGSADNTSEVASRYPGVRCVRQDNRGLAGARNTGIRRTNGSFLVFLDADDRLLPDALEAGLGCFEEHPECAFVYGRCNFMTFDGAPLETLEQPRVESGHYLALLRDCYIWTPATVMYRREAFDAVGGFDTSVSPSADYDLYLRIARDFPIHSYDKVVAEYRQHGANMGRNSALMLKASMIVVRSQWPHVIQSSSEYKEAYESGIRAVQDYYGVQLVHEVHEHLEAGEWLPMLRGVLALLRHAPQKLALVIQPFFAEHAELLRPIRGLRRKAAELRRVLEKKTKIQQHTHGHDTEKETMQREGAPRRSRNRYGENLILLYHRVTDVPSDPWALSVTPDHFAGHLEILREYTRPICLQQLSQGLYEGDLPDRSVVVTFDDGYADNLLNAKPLLNRYDVPATVFLTTGLLDHGRESWWDELEQLLLQPGTLPKELRLSVNGYAYEWELGETAHYPEDAFELYRSWKIWEDVPSTRHSLYRSLWELLYAMPHDERRSVLDELLAWAGTDPVRRPTHRFLSLSEVSDLAQGSLLDVGAHTVTHPTLAALPASRQRDEIQQSKARLEEVLGHRVTHFAYPHGTPSDYSPETIAIVREAGFACACSSLEGVVEKSTDRFQLPRVHVQDWNEDEFARLLSGWLGSK